MMARSSSIKQQIITYIATLACMLFLIIYVMFTGNSTTSANTFTIWPGPASQPIEPTEFQVQKNNTKPTRFLIMIQTDICPTNLTTEDTFGNSESCNCDVLVLTFKEKCQEPPPALHIEYIFKTDTSWNTGRNLMLQVGRNRTEKYLYYIFVDDDIKLITGLEDINPWWTFLEFLTRVEPAIGVVDYTWNVRNSINAMRRLGCGKGVSKETIEYLNAPNFDSAFNAFHYQAVDYILPYPTRFDSISWWWSGFYAKVMCDLVFPGNTMMLSKVNTINPQHRPYPRKMPYDIRDWRIIMTEVEARLPEKYRNSRLYKDWKRIGWSNEDKSTSHCFPHPTPHTPLTPYSHLESR